MPPPVLRTELLAEQVERLLTFQPQVADYIRGPDRSASVSAEAVVACYFIESTTWQYGTRPLVKAADIKAAEIAVRNELTGRQEREPRSTLPLLAVLPDLFETCCNGGFRMNSPDEPTAAIRLDALIGCLMPAELRGQEATAVTDTDEKYHSPWDLDVQGRPDITELKRRLLTRGGRCFEPNYVLATAIQSDFAAQLLQDGRFWPAVGCKLVPMEERECHGNVRLLAGREGIEVWTGLALSCSQWVLHSWCIHGDTVLETTTLRQEYFGIHFPMPFVKLIAELKANSTSLDHRILK